MGSGGKWRRRERKYIRTYGHPPPKSFYASRQEYLRQHNERTLQGMLRNRREKEDKKSILNRATRTIQVGLASIVVNAAVSGTNLSQGEYLPPAPVVEYVEDSQVREGISQEEKIYDFREYEGAQIMDMVPSEIAKAITKSQNDLMQCHITKEEAEKQGKLDQRDKYNQVLGMFISLQVAHFRKTGNYFGEKYSLKSR